MLFLHALFFDKSLANLVNDKTDVLENINININCSLIKTHIYMIPLSKTNTTSERNVLIFYS